MAAPLLEPWLALPRIESPVRLIDSGADLDGLFDMPDGSTLTVASVDMATGDLHTARWRSTGDVGFYPASTIKWITAAMAVAWMDQHDMSPETVIQLGDERPATMRELILSSLMMSDNAQAETIRLAKRIGDPEGFFVEAMSLIFAMQYSQDELAAPEDAPEEGVGDSGSTAGEGDSDEEATQTLDAEITALDDLTIDGETATAMVTITTSTGDQRDPWTFEQHEGKWYLSMR